MTQDIHPHWQSTDDGPEPVPEPDPAKGGIHISVKPASRLPAAIVGIAVFTIVGVTVTGGWQAMNHSPLSGSWGPFTAQVDSGSVGNDAATSSSDALIPVEIHISESDGFQPASVTLKPGQQITWINDQSIPHILTSQTLRDGSGAYLNTPAIFPGATTTFTVGPQEPEREHTITSSTDQTLIGTIVVSAAEPCYESSTQRDEMFGGTEGIDLPYPSGKRLPCKKSSSSSTSSRVASSSSTESSVAQLAAVQEASLPPLPPMDVQGTVPATTIDAFSPMDMPYAAPSQPAPFAPWENSIAPATPVANGQPSTGPGLWAVCLMSIGIFGGMTRKYFRRVA